jgi:hypothetical protein
MERIAISNPPETSQLARVGLTIYLPLGGTLLPDAAFYRSWQVSDPKENLVDHGHTARPCAQSPDTRQSDTPVWVRIGEANGTISHLKRERLTNRSEE